MPGFDRTGPAGQGPRTGGGFGYCAPTASPQADGSSDGLGVGRGGLPRGGGRGFTFGGGRSGGRGGWRRRAYPAAPAPVQMSPEQELTQLKEQSQTMQEQLNQINARIADLTSEQE